MSKLDELINELCPNGVEAKTISEVCNISRGVVISKDYISYKFDRHEIKRTQCLQGIRITVAINLRLIVHICLLSCYIRI